MRCAAKVELEQVDASALFRLGNEKACDPKSRDNKEHPHSQIAYVIGGRRAEIPRGMAGDHQQDGHRSQAVQRGDSI